MTVRDWFHPPRSLLTLYLAGAALTLACLGWLAVRQWQQDEALDAQRTSERLRAAANLAAARALQSLAEFERALSESPSPSTRHAHVVTVPGGGFRVIAGRLPYVPESPASTPLPDGTFDDAEQMEVQPSGRPRAVAVYRELANSASNAVRAGALVRLARVLRREGRDEAALRVYATLESLDAVVIEGRPADLIARRGRCAIFEHMERHADLANEAKALMSDLERGRWPIARPLWESIAADATRWSHATRPGSDPVAEQLAAAAALEHYWREQDGAPLTGSARAALATPRGEAIVLAQPTSEGSRLLVIAPAQVAVMLQRLSDARTTVVLRRLDASSPTQDRAATVTLLAAQTGLPWTLVARDADPGRVEAEARARRTMWLGGLGLVSLLILASSYLTFRGIRREIAMARLQSDFVSAVSHEFRTPLTSIRQLSHMLHTGRVSSEARRDQYYAVLVRESERLHRLVERMLGIGRADAGRFRFEPLDAVALVQKVVSDFATQAATASIDVDVSRPCPIRGDEEMLALALWNLLDNAVKYSDGSPRVQVDVTTRDHLAVIAVTDRGIGISTQDRARIFDKFVRGSSETVAATAGSGLGLAFVERVVRAHGGRVDVTSEPGRGSTFSVVIPLDASAHAAARNTHAEEVQS